MAATMLAILVAACGAAPKTLPPLRSLGTGERWLPGYQRPLTEETISCVGGGFIDDHVVLHGSPSDPRMAWLTFSDGTRKDIGWVPGTSARFVPQLEVVGPDGTVVAREGAIVGGGCSVERDPGHEYIDLPALP